MYARIRSYRLQQVIPEDFGKVGIARFKFDLQKYSAYVNVQGRFAHMNAMNVGASALRGQHAAPRFLLHKHINVHHALMKPVGPRHLELVSQYAVELLHVVAVKQMRNMGGCMVDALLPVLTAHSVIAIQFVFQAAHQCRCNVFRKLITNRPVNAVAVLILDERTIGLEVRKGDTATQQDIAVKVEKQAGNAGDAMQHGFDCARIVRGKVLGRVEENDIVRNDL
jgi:hypothetical protein